MRLGIVAPKNTPAERAWLASFFPFPAEEYRPRRRYDAVFFWNLTPEVARIRARTRARICAVCVEPEWLWPHNYDPALLQHCDYYSAYRNFADGRFRGVFHPFVYFADSAANIRTAFASARSSERTLDFVCFARHDPNIRRRIGEELRGRNAALAGPLFGNPVADKTALQRTARFEFITENVINDWYLTEKLPQALMAGCVPVYYGCTRAADRVPADLFIDLRAFGDPAAPGVLRAAAEHCLAPGVYAGYFDRILRRAEILLTECFSLERTVVGPIASFLAPSPRAGPPGKGAP